MTIDNCRKNAKSIDEHTLEKLAQYINTLNGSSFTAKDTGEAVNLSRITARRDLESLEAQGQVCMTLDYKTGGRPKQHYTKKA